MARAKQRLRLRIRPAFGGIGFLEGKKTHEGEQSYVLTLCEFATLRELGNTSELQGHENAIMGGKHVPEEASHVTDDAPSPKRHHRSKSKQLREIKKYQSTTDLLLPKAPFERLVRAIAQRRQLKIRFRPSAINALQRPQRHSLLE
jgi:hypothetical protein